MGFLEDLLGNGEEILYIARRHIFVLISSILTELLLIVLLIAAGVASQVAFPGREIGGIAVGPLIMVVSVLISALVVVGAVFDYLRWNNEIYAITDMRVIHVKGVFNKLTTDSSLDKINDVSLSQTLLGRTFNYGDLEILTGADTGVSLLQQIDSPIEFKRAMLDAKRKYHRSYDYYSEPVAADVPVGRGRSVQDLLDQLTELHDQGVLSREEFEAKRRDLMRRSS